MREHFLRSGMRSQATHEGEESVLRGYDSLREIDHWHLIIVLLILGMTGVVFILSPAFNNLSSLDAESWSLYAGSALILLFVLFLVSLPLWAFIHQRREQKKRDTLRRSAIKAHSSPLAPIQPPPFHTLVLP